MDGIGTGDGRDVHVFLYPDSYDTTKIPDPIEDNRALFRFRDFGLVYWEGGVGQQAKLIPWHRIRHVMFDRGAGEHFDLDSR